MKSLHKKLQPVIVVLGFAFIGAFFIVRSLAAGSGQVYISPATASVQNGSNTTVAVRVNTAGPNADTAQMTLTYDPAKLQVVSIDSSSSPFNISANYKDNGSGTISGGAFTTTPVSGDLLIANITFKALAGSGSTALAFLTTGVYPTEVDSGGNSITGSTIGASITLTTPPPTCPTGQVGTPPNCTTPPPASSGSGSSSKAPSSGSSSKSSSSSSTSSGNSTPAPTTSTKPTVTASPSQIQFTQASIIAYSNVPVQTYISYGPAADQLSHSTPVTSFATNNTIALDPSLLIPGTTYYYSVVVKDQQGNTTQSPVATFQTKGYTVKITVLDKNHHLLQNQKFTLFSNSLAGKTNSQGVVTFTNVSPGQHHLEFVTSQTKVNQSLYVANDYTTVKGLQMAIPQNVSVVLTGYAQSQFPLALIWVVLVILVLVAGFYFRRNGQLKIWWERFSNHQTVQPNFEYAGSQINGSDSPLTDMQARLSRIPDSQLPSPGNVIAPSGETSQDQAEREQ